MKIIYVYIIIAITILFSACVETLNYELNRETEKLVISAQFTDVLEEQEVTVEKSVLLDKNANSRGLPITGAVVKIISENQEILFLEKIPGRYFALTKGEANKAYKLVVEINGEKYESTQELMPEKGNDFEAKAQYLEEEILTKAGNIVKETKVNLLVSGKIEDNDYYYMRTKGEYEFAEYDPMSTRNKSCYIPILLDQIKVNLLSKEILNSNFYKDVSINKADATDYYFTNFCYHVYQYKINKKAYQYWKRVSQVLNTGSGLFESPPGKLLGNIRNINKPNEEVLGYFTVGAVKSLRTFTNGFDLGIKVIDPCGFVFNRPRPTSCSNCLLIPNSTSIKPSYWR